MNIYIYVLHFRVLMSLDLLLFLVTFLGCSMVHGTETEPKEELSIPGFDGYMNVMLKVLPWIIRLTFISRFLSPKVCFRCAATLLACTTCNYWFSIPHSCFAICIPATFAQCGRMLGISAAAALSELEVTALLDIQ